MNATTVPTNGSKHGISQSEKTTEIAKSLLAFQSEMPTVTKDANNPFFKSKYATLANIWHACQPILAKHGLIISQSSGSAYKVGNDTFNDFHTRIIHAESGEWIEAVSAIPVGKTDPQGYGSTNTYSRRYCLTPLIGIVVDDDDDGNAASGRGDDRKKTQPKSKQADPPPEPTNEEKVKKFLHSTGCQNKEDAEMVLDFIAPGNTLETIKTDSVAAGVWKIIEDGKRDKTLIPENVLEEARIQSNAADAAGAFPI